MPAELVIRRAKSEDTERLGELAGRLVRAHHAADPARFMLVPDIEAGYGRWLGREAKRREAVVLVAELLGVVVGYAYGALGGRDWNELLDEHGALHDILVDDAHRRAGIGGRLLDAMLAELDALGAPRVVLKTMTGNEPAQRLFASRGFRRTMIEMTKGG
jgi:ribosomal protein S18 acetylase RimI-like enzyme